MSSIYSQAHLIMVRSLGGDRFFSLAPFWLTSSNEVEPCMLMNNLGSRCLNYKIRCRQNEGDVVIVDYRNWDSLAIDSDIQYYWLLISIIIQINKQTINNCKQRHTILYFPESDPKESFAVAPTSWHQNMTWFMCEEIELKVNSAFLLSFHKLYILLHRACLKMCPQWPAIRH